MPPLSQRSSKLRDVTDRQRSLQGSLRFRCRGALLLALAMALGIPQALWRLAFPHATQGPLPRLFHRLGCRILGLRIEVVGQPVFTGTIAWVGNHLSYLDIPVLGSLGTLRFVAKQEIADWPLFGWLAGLQRTVYISRRPRDAAMATRRFAEALAAGGVVVMFPEGTSGDGSAVLPFRPSLLQALMASTTVPQAVPETAAQAFTLRLQSADGHPADQPGISNLYAYYGDMVLLPHLKRFLGLRGARVQLVFHPPVMPSAFPGRRALAAHLQRQVEWGLAHGAPAA
jgi:1-acyl-sn-glycerol-3-phosphate acyltransferase